MGSGSSLFLFCNMWKCPECGKEYEVQPKWCGCTPFPMGDSGVSYYLRSPKEDGLAEIRQIGMTDYQRMLNRIQNPKFREHSNFDIGFNGGFELVEQDFSPGVETLDHYNEKIVDLTPEQFQAFISLLD